MSLEKHPDRNPDNPLAVQEFIRLTKAYNVSQLNKDSHHLLLIASYRSLPMKLLTKTSKNMVTQTVLAATTLPLLCPASFSKKIIKFLCSAAPFSSYSWSSLASSILTLVTRQRKTSTVLCWVTSASTCRSWTRTCCRKIYLSFWHSQLNAKPSAPRIWTGSSHCWRNFAKMKISMKCYQSNSQEC